MTENKLLDLNSQEDFSEALIEQTKVLTSVAKEIEDFIENIRGFFKEFSKYSLERKKAEKKMIKEIGHNSDQIADYIDHIHIEITALVDVIRESEKQQAEYQKTIEELKKELEDQKRQNIELKQKYEEQLKKTNEIKEQFEFQKKVNNDLQNTNEQLDAEKDVNLTYTALIGSVLSKMLWKTSRSKETIQTYIDTGTMNNFLNLVNKTITTFKVTYKDELPTIESYEFQFILSLLGICINIMAQDVGREFVLEREIGQNLFKNVISYMEAISMTSAGGPLLKRIIIMLLYNLTFTKQGSFLIESCDNSVDNIIKCFNVHHTAEIQSIAISLMNQLLKDSQTKDFCLKVREKISKNQDDFKMFMNTADDETKEKCNQLINHIRDL